MMTFDEWWEQRGDSLSSEQGDDPYAMALHGWEAAWEAAQPKWRPMSEAPKKGLIDVLLLRKNGRQAVASYTHVFFDRPEGCWAYNDEIVLDPIAWMQLPISSEDAL